MMYFILSIDQYLKATHVGCGAVTIGPFCDQYLMSYRVRRDENLALVFKRLFRVVISSFGLLMRLLRCVRFIFSGSF